ncbi:MAG TPA: arsinothricin resistance N-acetyltransferase ArsN1 family A [Candidatus Limnocylindrales bacterium]|jgi:phosphinothricin acetyltransferase|nr:arsinothricin resistance N-acetyltransferase ArsN1 family A [Candidatus Limnocylindrales bacterium]
MTRATAKARAKAPPDPNALTRESAGRYATADGRFAVEQASAGSWALIDQEGKNELGLPLVRGPFPTLAAARSALAAAREGPAPESPLAARLAKGAESSSRGGRPNRREARATRALPPKPSPPPRLVARLATAGDAAAIVRIYNAGIDSHEATFETEPRSRTDIVRWFDGSHPVVVVVRGPDVVSFAATFPYRTREAYRGVAEFSVYADPGQRRQGAGRLAIERLIEEATEAGFWKLVSRVFPENAASRGLLQKVGFREVGTYRRHARLDGHWRDCVIVERLLGEALEA